MIDELITLARRHVADLPANESSARACLADAARLYAAGADAAAARWALASLRYSCGVFHSAYKRGDELFRQEMQQ